MTAEELIDEAVEEPVLIFGSLPPHGRDLDLLAKNDEQASIKRVLEEQGFVRGRDEWVRFRSCTAEIVELVPVERWRLSTAEEEALFTDAVPIDGRRRLVRPAPHHALLILARRLALGGFDFDEKLRRRLYEALAEDPGAWASAEEHAEGWSAASALRVLRVVADGGSPSPADRYAARRELRPLIRRGRKVATTAALKRATRVRSRRGCVIAFSGLDGSGKTTHANTLQSLLLELGVDTRIEWTRLSHNPSLHMTGRVVKAVLNLARVTRRAAGDQTLSAAADPGSEFRRRSGVLTYVWVSLVALANGIAQRRATARHVRRGTVVLCDRYTLDSVVHLRYRYGEDRAFRFQIWLIRTISPRPLRSFFIDVSPQLAWSRKADDFTPDQLARQATMYREQYRWANAHRLDGERHPHDLCDEIAGDVWRALWSDSGDPRRRTSGAAPGVQL